LLLVAEGHRLELKNSFACFVHWFDRFLVASRGLNRAQVPGGINDHSHAARYRLVVDAGNEGAARTFANADFTRLARYSLSADVDVVISGGEIKPCLIAQSDVVCAGRVFERRRADRRVVIADCIAEERVIAHGSVVAACGVVIKSKSTVGRVAHPTRIEIKGAKTAGRIAETGLVRVERLRTRGRVLAAGRVVRERFKTAGRVVVAGGVVIERKSTVGRVVDAGG